MPFVKLESLQEGMIVMTDVKNMDNMLLIPSGCALSSKHINVLSAWGITEIQVQTCEGAEESGDILKELPPERLEEITQILAAAFWDPIDKDPVQKEVFDLMLRRKVRQTLCE